MPNCKKCNNHFSIRQYSDGRIRNTSHRKYCYDCSPLIKKGKYIEPDKDGFVNCISCLKPFLKSKQKRQNTDRCRACKAKNKRHNRMKKCVEYKGSKCVVCGYCKCKTALHFHHIDAKEKKFTIGSNHCRSWSSVKLELDKCVLICANCHSELHEGMISI